MSVLVDTFGTGKVSQDRLEQLVRAHFDLRPYGIIKMLDLVVGIAFAVALVPILWSERKMQRWEGALLFGSYVGYVVWIWPK